MRQTIIWSVALVCAALILATGGAEAQKSKVVEVSGTIEVSKLPPSGPQFAGFTQALFPEFTEILPLSHSCAAEFPGTRLCEQQEFLLSIPPPPPSSAGGSMVIYQKVPANLGKDLVEDPLLAGCIGSNGTLFLCGEGTIFPGPFPAACCGF